MKKTLALSFLLISDFCFAQDIKSEGYVKNIGSSGQSRALVGEKLEACPRDLGEKVKKVAGFYVSVSGQKNEKENCIDVKSVEVLKSSRGEPVIKGKLVKAEGVWRMTSADGKAYLFQKIPKGMQALANKDLIVDAVAVTGPVASWKVVSYMINPFSE